METIEYQGIWWLPSNPDHRVAGILTLTPQEKIELDLIGSFMDVLKHDIILGVANRKLITLFVNRFIVHTNIELPGIVREKYGISLIFLGHHFDNINAFCFSKIRVNYTGLTDWINHKIDYSLYPPDSSNLSQVQELHFKYINKYTIVSNITQADITQVKISVYDIPEFSPEFSVNQKQLKLNCSGVFEIELNRELSLDQWYSDFIKPLCDFLTFATQKVNKIKKIWIYLEDNKPLEILTYKMDFNEYNPSLFSIHNMLFKLDDIEDNFGLIMQYWFNLYEKMKSVLELYFAVQYNSDLYLENKFLMLAQAVESYHRITKENNVLPVNEHEKRIELILDNTPDEYKEWLAEKLSYSNEPTLAERLKDLVNLHWLVMKSIIVDPDKFNKDIKNSRNYYTHFGQNLKEKALTGEKLIRATQKLNFLLQACFLSELGCTPERCLDLISRNNEYKYLQEIVNQ